MGLPFGLWAACVVLTGCGTSLSPTLIRSTCCTLADKWGGGQLVSQMMFIFLLIVVTH
ncbi:hypothetical protein BDQ17DRAFT_1360224 [Cyathus striatus]|nr:hypothetical protein BDQ17DRAFT_1360224 [Cyathus striatus]